MGWNYSASTDHGMGQKFIEIGSWIMSLCKKVFFISISTVCVIFVFHYAKGMIKNSLKQNDLGRYYASELEKAYIFGYAVDQNRRLILGQSEFEAMIQKIEELMLKESFSHEKIRKMKDEGCKKGQETRRLWDEFSLQERQNQKLAFSLK